MVNIELKKAANDVLDQLSSVLIQISNEEYNAPIKVLNNSTIGQHVRHTLEFYLCLLDGYLLGVVNYDKRNHDTQIEENRLEALSVLDKISRFIDKLESDQGFILELDYGIKENETSQINTNINRELAYNIEHAIHHMAIMKIGLQALCNHLEIPEKFGIANSTLKYKSQQVDKNRS